MKPHFRFLRGQWLCTCGAFVGEGASLWMAFVDMVKGRRTVLAALAPDMKVD
jgi:hypothetical protein